MAHDCPDEAQRILVVFLGLTTYHSRPIAELAEAHGVSRQVRVISPVPHKQAMAFLKGADVAILLGQSGGEKLASIPAKAYEYIGARKDVLAIGSGDEVCEVMRRGGCRIWRSPDDPNDIAKTLRKVLDHNIQNNGSEKTDLSERHTLTRSRMAEELGSILQIAIADRR